MIENQPLLRQIYKEPPIISYKRGRSLKDILVKAKLSELKAINSGWKAWGQASLYHVICCNLSHDKLTSCDNCPFYCAITSKKKKCHVPYRPPYFTVRISLLFIRVRRSISYLYWSRTTKYEKSDITQRFVTAVSCAWNTYPARILKTKLGNLHPF